MTRNENIELIINTAAVVMIDGDESAAERRQIAEDLEALEELLQTCSDEQVALQATWAARIAW
jgi:dTDP-4-dehydrorhamnose reductase